MSEKGRILLADDEETFSASVSHLLRNRGYECLCATDATAARKALGREAYNVLVADIKMPGNIELQWVKSVKEDHPQLPIIVVTGYPSLQTAIESVQLHLFSYFVKPFKFDQFFEQIQAAVEYHHLHSQISGLRDRIGVWSRDLERLTGYVGVTAGEAPMIGVETFVDSTLSHIVGCLSDIRHLTQALKSGIVDPNVCHLLNCPRPMVLIQAIRGAIRILEETKTTFKSRKLKQLREELVVVVENWPEF